jgi:hypothetical protein
MAKRLTLFLAVALLVLFTVGMVWSAKQNPNLTAPDRPIRGDESFDYLITKAPTVFPTAFCGETTIHSPYDTVIGCTWYDYQHNSRIPRMNANDYQTIAAGGHGRHYSFMHQDVWGTGAKRYISVTYFDQDYGWETLPAPVITAQGNRAGYCGMNIFMDSRGVPYYHTTEAVYPNTDDGGTFVSVEPNSPGLLEFKDANYWYDIPDSGGTGFKGMWPAADVDGDDQIHIVMNEGDTSPGPAWQGYVRCSEAEGGDTLFCQSPGLPVDTIVKETQYFDPLNEVYVYDTSGVIGANLTCSRVSDKIAIVYAALAETEIDSSLYQVSNDVFYIESPNGGDNWFTYPDSMQMRRNCSNYQVEDKMRCYGEVTGVYDFTDTLHVYWYTHYYDQEAAEIDINDVALWHFSEKTKRFCDGDTVYANKIHAISTEEAAAGAWNRLIAKITSGVGILEGDNKNYLYVTWTQFDTAKWNDAGNQTQGDIYTTVSTDQGMTWMVPVNVTNSTVDSCAAGDCASDHWGSMAERVDDSLYLQWIYDLDVGGVVQDEGEPTNNPVLVYAFAKDNIPLENKARIGWTPSDFLVPYIHCPPSGVVTRNLTIENIGTAALGPISLSETAGWLDVSPTNIASITAGGCPEKVTLTITGQGSEEFYVDSIHVTSNDQAGNNDFYIRLHVVMSDVYVTKDDKTIDNPILWVGVSNVGNLGNQVDTSGYYLHQDVNEPSLLYDASVLLAFTDDNTPVDSLVGRWIFNEHYLLPERDMVETDRAQLKTKIIDAEFNPTTPQAPLPWHHRWWFWTILTKDYMFYSASATDDKEQYLTLRYIKMYYNPPPPWWPDVTAPPSITPHYLGMGLDIDAPSDSGSDNYPGSDESRRMAFIRGYGGGANENYRMGIAQRDTCFWDAGATGPVYCCWPDPNTVAADIPFAMHVLRNDSVVYPYGGYDDAVLYEWMSVPGNIIQTDTLGDTPETDYNIVTTGRVIPAGSFPPVDTHMVAYALLITDRFEPDHLDSLVDMCMCGNANRDKAVTIADVVYIVSYLFKGGAEPWLFMSDVDATGVCDIADAVYLVTYLFKGGAAPQCSWDW